ncbi:30S ribosomal protein S16 [Candidatus Hodgkinia cicadicola]|nr:30S ribosomal protein S16 [Candidatus Hodgkinia cicadicola]
MVKIRLIPRQTSQNIVVADSRRARDAKVIDKLGVVCVKRNAPCVSVNATALKLWLRAGALPTRAAARLLFNVGLL